MAHSSILGGERTAPRAAGRDADALGPSDSSDSGSDIQGERSLSTTTEEGLPVGATPTERRSDTDAGGTGERSSAIPENVEDGADIAPDRVSGSDAFDAGPTVDLDDVADLAVDQSDEAPEGEDAGAP